MQVALKCKISLSKKMRNVLQNGGSIVLTSDSIASGKGEGVLVLSDNGNAELDVSDLMSKETSIMITPIEVSTGESRVTNIYNDQTQQPPSVSNIYNDNGQQSPNVQPSSRGVTNVFSDNRSNSQQRNPIDRMAATSPPEHGQNNRAYYNKDELTVPKQFEQTQDADFISYIKNYQELINAIKVSKDKQSSVNVEPISEYDSIHTKRQKALLLEQRDMQESIGCDAYVVNEMCASLTVSDIDLDLPLNMPKNLGNMSAKKLASSRQLWDLFRKDYIRLVSPNEADHLLKNAGTMNQTFVPELGIYDSRYEASDEIYTSGPGSRTPDADVIDLDASYNQSEESELMGNFRTARGGSPSGPPRGASGGSIQTMSGGTRRTFHGSNGMDEPSLDETYAGNDWKINSDNRHVGQESRRNSKGAQTIASRHSRRSY
jgi:hypothetical protein